MDELSHLQKEISDLTNILSLITRRTPDFEESDNEPRSSEPPRSEDHEADLETGVECVDEADFEAPIAPKDAEFDALKRKALDRLAEVLARFKSTKGSRNPDAKHVTSVVMVEELNDKTITFLCAKNEGLDAVDMDFLRKLEDILRKIAANEISAKDGQTKQVDQVFDALFDHSKPRIKHYSTILHNVIEEAGRTVALPKTLTNQTVQEDLHQVTLRDWEDNNGFIFSFRPGGIGEESTSDKALDCFLTRRRRVLSRRFTAKSNISSGTLSIKPHKSLPRIF